MLLLNDPHPVYTSIRTPENKHNTRDRPAYRRWAPKSQNLPSIPPPPDPRPLGLLKQQPLLGGILHELQMLIIPLRPDFSRRGVLRNQASNQRGRGRDGRVGVGRDGGRGAAGGWGWEVRVGEGE